MRDFEKKNELDMIISAYLYFVAEIFNCENLKL